VTITKVVRIEEFLLDTFQQRHHTTVLLGG